jgi:hypothetical protein
MPDFMFSNSFEFTIVHQSLVIFYIQLPRDLSGKVEIAKDKGAFRMAVSSDDLNLDTETFLHTKGLAG